MTGVDAHHLRSGGHGQAQHPWDACDRRHHPGVTGFWEVQRRDSRSATQCSKEPTSAKHWRTRLEGGRARSATRLLMKILLDMNLSPGWAVALRQHGHEASTGQHLGGSGRFPTHRHEEGQHYGCLVLTRDLDFGAALAASQEDASERDAVSPQDVSPDALRDRVVETLLEVSRNHSRRGTDRWWMRPSPGSGFSFSGSDSHVVHRARSVLPLSPCCGRICAAGAPVGAALGRRGPRRRALPARTRPALRSRLGEHLSRTAAGQGAGRPALRARRLVGRHRAAADARGGRAAALGRGRGRRRGRALDPPDRALPDRARRAPPARPRGGRLARRPAVAAGGAPAAAVAAYARLALGAGRRGSRFRSV